MVMATFIQSEYFKNSAPSWFTVVAVIAIVAIIAYNIIRHYYNIYSSRRPLTHSSQAPRAQVPTPFHGFGFRRIGHEIGFSNDQISFLEAYGKKFQVTNPEHTLRNPQALDEFLKKVFTDIENHVESEAIHDQKSSTLFQIREYIDQARSSGKPISNTHILQKGTAFTFITPEEDHYTSRFVSVDSGGLASIIPKDGLGQELRFKRGTKLNCFFYSGPQAGYTFETKVLGYIPWGASSLMVLRHSEHVEALPTRKHRRRETSIPCDLTPVNIVVVKNTPKPARQAVISGRAFPGQVLDMSAGGLSVRSIHTGDEGAYYKIDFTLPQGNLAAICRIVKLNPLKASGGIMHLQFAKISRRDINKILSYVYGYAD
jgi:hypothetical protein